MIVSDSDWLAVLIAAIGAGWLGAWGYHLHPTWGRAFEATGVGVVVFFIGSAWLAGVFDLMKRG
jgi:hypothetical protein